MTFEEEQLQYAKELKSLSHSLQGLEYLFRDPLKTNEKLLALYKKSHSVTYKSESELYNSINRYKQILERDYQNKLNRKIELECLLSQSPAERAKHNVKNSIVKTTDYIASITPQHISGKIYRVENKNGCGMFCLWFMIIDAIIIFLYFLISGDYK